MKKEVKKAVKKPVVTLTVKQAQSLQKSLGKSYKFFDKKIEDATKE